MRLLVHSRSLEGSPRMLAAAWGLGERGHDVRWLGGALPPGASFGGGVLGARRVERAADARPADMVVGGWGGLGAAAWAAWMASAHAAVVDLGNAAAPRGGLLREAAWGILDAVGFVAPEPGLRGAAEADRVEAWPAELPAQEPDPTHPDVEALERACERLAARQRTRGSRPAVFLDRDGTLVVERGYLAHPDDIELLPGVPAALRALRAAGYALVVVSNQSGVGRGLFALSSVHEAMARLRVELRRHDVELDAIYFCPHRPDAGCPCRKPSAELLRRAAENLRLSLRDSTMVGDKVLDLETARAAGARGILVRTGYGRSEAARLEEPGSPVPARVAEDLGEAAAWLLDAGPA